LIHNGGLVKTINFSEHKYVGDPINAVRIFNEKEADELIILDIDATVKNVEPNFKLISKLANECQMPLCYGGGIKNLDQAMRLVDMGVEKVALSSAAIENPALLTQISESAGKQSVVAVLDVVKQKRLMGYKYSVCSHNAMKKYPYDLFSLISSLQAAGVGEILINSVNCDGKMQGYDLDLVERVSAIVDTPLTIMGGAGTLQDMNELIGKVGVVGAAAGSLFVFRGKYRAVLINYPTHSQKQLICQTQGNP
jgi:imidazole glycerol-phosphate synthase subunit HisF